jgi:3-isopropylmalate dehydrogenase
MKSYKIAVIPGDGTGPEVVREGMKVMDVAAKKHDFRLDYTTFDFGGERYLKTGKILDDSEVQEMKKYDSIYLGAIGHPDVKPGLLEKGILLKLRFDLDQYINLRPVRLYYGVETPLKNKDPRDIDFVVVRENSAGLYKGEGGILHPGTPDEETFQVMRYTKKEITRCLKFAFDYAQNSRQPRPWMGLSKEETDKGLVGKLTLAHKTNVLTFCGDQWFREFTEMSKQYPKIKTDYNHVDACTMWFVKNPEFYDVIVTENMFGDIITDLGAMIQGGMGIAAGGNLNPEGVSMFEPIGGSAPKYTGQNVINPLAAVEAGRMMLSYLGEKDAADDMEGAVRFFLDRKKIKGLSVKEIQESGFSTSKIGDWIADYIAKN